MGYKSFVAPLFYLFVWVVFKLLGQYRLDAL